MAAEEKSLLELMRENELAIRRLYELFADRFPDRQSMWLRLALDEKKHADWLDMLMVEPILRDAFLTGFPIKPGIVRSSIAYLAQVTEQAQAGTYSLQQALEIARNLENSLLETQFAHISDAVPEEIRLVLQQLGADTQRHRNELAAEYNAVVLSS